MPLSYLEALLVMRWSPPLVVVAETSELGFSLVAYPESARVGTLVGAVSLCLSCLSRLNKGMLDERQMDSVVGLIFRDVLL